MFYKNSKNLIFIILSLLIVVLLVNYSLRAIGEFEKYNKVVLSGKKELTIERFHFFINNEIKKDFYKLVSTMPQPDSQSSLKTFRISIDPKYLRALNSDLPASGKEQYYEAYLKVTDAGNLMKVKLRYRGDNNFHWLYDQKSLRIKLEGNDVYNMERVFNLINPPHIFSTLDVLNYKYAKELELISPDYEPVRVFLNGKYMGVYMYLSQVDESLLRKHKRMPGSIYAGDIEWGSKLGEHGEGNLWGDSNLWKKVSARNAEQKNDRSDIDYFIEKINSDEFNIFFENMVDSKKWFGFMALDVIFGSNHHDHYHNHKIYFDPYRGKFEPIEWDLRFWTNLEAKDLSQYPMLNKIKLNPVLEYKRDMVAYELLQSESYSVKKTLSDLENVTALLQKDLSSDYLKDHTINKKEIFPSWFSAVFSMKEFKTHMDGYEQVIKKRRKYLRRLYSDAIFYANIENYDKYQKLTFIPSGNSPVYIKSADKARISAYRDSNFNGLLDENDKKIQLDDEIIYPGRKWNQGSLFGWPDFQYSNRHLINAPLKYEYFVKRNNITLNKLEFRNAITSTLVKYDDVLPSTLSVDSIHPWTIDEPRHRHIVLEGEIHLEKTVEYNKHTNVTIMPGTTFVISPNVSIYFFGKVTAVGTANKPIKFMAKDLKKPWGLIAVQGKSASGSDFKYIEIENGSVDTRNLIHYTSPFNIHDVDWFEVDNCRIGKNFVGDDAMHVAYSKGIISNCEFTDARSDALDIDISEVTVKDNIFYNSGNDALDIMTTKMNASNNLFINTDDKGISVGEWSDAKITDSLFINNEIAIEVKDKSSVNSDNLIIANAKAKAINLYNKNKRYDDGGHLLGIDITFIGNALVKADKKSSSKLSVSDNIVTPYDQLIKMPLFNKYNGSKYKDIMNKLESDLAN